MNVAVITLLIVLVMAIFFVTEKLPLAVVSMSGAIVLSVLGIIPVEDVFSSFSGSTVILIGCMMVIGSALFHTGLAELISAKLVRVTGTSENGIMAATVIVAIVLSSICSGIGVVATLLPIIVGMSMQAKVSVSRQLIPLAFAASLGCNLTLVGAASNVSTAGLIEDMGIPFLSFFELGKIGIPLCIVAVIYFLTIGKKFMTPGDSSDEVYLKEFTKKSDENKTFNPVKATICAVILIAVLIAMAVANENFPMYYVAAIGVLLLLITGCIKQDEAVKACDWPTLFIVGGMSAVSKAMSASGAGEMIANGVVKILGDNPNKILFLFIILLLTVVLTNIMMNTSTVLLVTPLFIPIALAINVNPVAIGVAICVAASAPFLTPVGSGTNTLVIKPGNLKFRDFFVPGLGLTVVVLVVSMIGIPLIWPL